MKASEAQVLYTPINWPNGIVTTQGRVAVHAMGRAGDDWSRYAYKVGACFSDVQAAKGHEATARVLALFQRMVIRDGIDPSVAHRALMQIDEYAQAACDAPMREA